MVSEALAAPFSGWDFSWLAASYTDEPLPWSYRSELARRAAGARSMLDMGTGGGEFLSRLDLRPPRTVATEGWPPNVTVAGRRPRFNFSNKSARARCSRDLTVPIAQPMANAASA